MKLIPSILCVICGAALALMPNPASGVTNFISGMVTTDTTWSGTNHVSGTVVVTNGAVLTIAPGTRMLMNTGATLLVYGQLLAHGTSNEPIQFTRATSTARWGRIMLDRAQPSALRHCVIEYSNCAGDHKDYYPTSCDPPVFRPRTNYHEAVVALGCHIDIEGCVFQNLPAASGEGDAIAIISDHPDPTNTNLWNSASGTVRNSRFIDIGQGVHTRYAYVLVEGCYFTSHNGDNDDVDLFGESSPPPMVRSNVFLYAYDDFINPTRCSAIIMDNIFIGTNNTDHGIVLRDVGRPIVMNNIVYGCTSGGISIQNGCDALLINNTIVNCNRAIKLFDHLDRTNATYCLAPQSGRATLVNNIIWNSTPALDLSGNAFGVLSVSVSYSDIQGGTNNATRRANAVIIGGPGNIDADPGFFNASVANFRILSGSPAIDAGTNAGLFLTNALLALDHDLDGTARPLDGDGDGFARYDMGAFEFLLPTADSNGDGIPDGWTQRYGFSPIDPGVASANADDDPQTNFEEWLADTDPRDPASFFRIASLAAELPIRIGFEGSTNRAYTLFYTDTLGELNGSWNIVPGQAQIPGSGGATVLIDTNTAAPQRFYRVGVELP